MDLLWICYAWVWPLGVRYETAMGPRWICGGSAMGRPWVWHGPPMAPLCVSNLPAIMDPSQTCCLHDVRLHGYAVCMLWAAKRAWTLRWVRHEESAPSATGPSRKNLLRVRYSGVWPESAAFSMAVLCYTHATRQKVHQMSADRPPLGMLWVGCVPHGL